MQNGLSKNTPVSDEKFNKEEVGKRDNKSVDEILEEYNKAHKDSLIILHKLPKNKFGKPGLIPWYGKEYSLEDLIVYMYYGHKREHAAQIEIFREKYNKKSLRFTSLSS